MPMLKTIVFDLDDTLYPAGSGLMEHVGLQMVRFLQQTTGLSLSDCEHLRKKYVSQYGTTLAGLQQEYQVDREEYIRFVHSAHPSEFLSNNKPLDDMLSRLPQRKVIFTNGPSEHAERTLAVLGIRHHFDLLLDLRAFDWQPKPTPRPYELLMNSLQHQATGAIYIDDRLHNLRPASRLGMKTVFIGQEQPESEHPHFHINEILELEPLLQSMLD